MALTLADALRAFSHLQDNLPAWINRVSELASHTSAKHAEYSEAYRQHTSFKSRRRRSSAACFIHADNIIANPQREGPYPVEAVEAVTTMTNGTTEPTQCARRVYGPNEAPSLQSTELHTFVSTRYNVIVEYDGHTQKVLGEIARDISIARKNMRRGKMSIMSHTGVRAGLLNKAVSLNSHKPGGTEHSRLPVVACVRSKRTRSTGTQQESPFNFPDKQLELAHGLCETAAYQVLRSGDCGTELDGVEEKFRMILEMASNEVGRLTKTQLQTIEEATPTKLPPPNAERSASPALFPQVIS